MRVVGTWQGATLKFDLSSRLRADAEDAHPIKKARSFDNLARDLPGTHPRRASNRRTRLRCRRRLRSTHSAPMALADTTGSVPMAL